MSSLAPLSGGARLELTGRKLDMVVAMTRLAFDGGGEDRGAGGDASMSAEARRGQ